MFDAHCHLQFAAFDADRADVVRRAVGAGLRGMIVAGYDGGRRALSASLMQTPGIWATAGVHPWAVAEMDDRALDQALDALSDDLQGHDWCGLGELGLDYYRVKDQEGRARQRRAFVQQLGMAREANLPVVIHGVRCHNTLLRILRDEGLPEAGGMMHGYSGSPRQIGSFLMLNLDISLGTAITFQNRPRQVESLRQTPKERLLLESDAPDQRPRGFSGQRNELHQLSMVIDAVAQVWDCPAEVVARKTEANCRRRFGLEEAIVLDEATIDELSLCHDADS